MRVLVTTVTAGGGHLAAAAALEEAWRLDYPADTVEQIDLVKFFSPLHRKIHADGYEKLVQHAPEIWGMMFSKTDDPKAAARVSRIRRLFTSTSRLRFRRFLHRVKPEVALCTHYLPLEPLAELKQERGGSATSTAGPGYGTTPFVVSVVTDFEAHALWMHPGVDLYCVATEETRNRLVARGASPEKIVVTGIPIAPKFARLPKPTGLRKNLGLRDDLPVVLVLSGGFGMGPIAQVLAELNHVESLLQTIVVTGRNQELRRELAANDYRHPARVLGFAGNMEELMLVADLIITKPGGLTTSEALAVGKPLIVLNPIPGQEAANSDFLLEHGAALKVNRVEDLPFKIQGLLGSARLKEMARAAKALGRPESAAAVCKAVLQRLGPSSAPPASA